MEELVPQFLLLSEMYIDFCPALPLPVGWRFRAEELILQFLLFSMIYGVVCMALSPALTPSPSGGVHVAVEGQCTLMLSLSMMYSA